MHRSDHEPRWHAALAVLAALALYVTLPRGILLGPLWVMPAIVLVMLVPLLIFSPRRHEEAPWQRVLSIAHILVLNAFNIATIVLLFVWQLSEKHHRALNGEQLLVAAVQIWLTNVIVYALWFWEIDGRGPDVRSHLNLEQRTVRGDFIFPQQILDQSMQEKLQFKPRFLDYVFLSFTNATAFSPTDTFPITHTAKVLMMLEAITSLVTVAIIAGRAINILGG
ncbi:MAG TPA: hypothetical protein VFL13_03215 [Candidatus Baltobacteraceae bacterium]|nr:hypothetical protein [Candidatus Baltobacteraceae bacterium]